MADSKIPLSDLPEGVPGAFDKVAGVDTATGASRLFPLPQPGVPKAYATRASLPAAGGLTAGTAAWVTNDPNPLLNGTWSVQAGAWVQSADRVTGLEGRLGDAENKVDVLQAVTFENLSVEFEQGSLGPNDGNEVASATRIRTRMIPAEMMQVGTDSTQDYAVLRYNDAGVFVEWTNWITVQGTAAYAGPNIRVLVRKKNGANIVPGESSATISVDSISRGDRKVEAAAVAYADDLIFNVLDSSVVPLEQGSFSPGSGEPAASSTRVRSADFVAATEVSVSVPAGLVFSLWRFDENKNFVDSTPLSAAPISRRMIPGYFKLLFAKAATGNTIVPAEVSFTASIFQDKFARAGADLAADLPVRPEGLPPEKLWADALTVKVVREYDSLYLPTPRPAATHAGVYALTDALMAEFPDYITRQEIGRSELDKPIFAYRLTPGVYRIEGPNTYPYESVALPKIILATGVHGDEPISIKASLLYIADLCRRWKELPLLADVRWGVDLIFVPLVNPDGYDANTRHNANDVNINRDFGILSQSESQAVSGLMLAHPDAIGYIDHHNYGTASVVNYALWVGAEGPGEMGVAAELIRQMTVDVRTLWSDAVPDDNSPRAIMTNQIGTTTSSGYAHGLGLNAFLLETPQALPSWSDGVRVAAHAMTATARLIKIIHDREARRRLSDFTLAAP